MKAKIKGPCKTILIQIIGDRDSSGYHVLIENGRKFRPTTPFKLKKEELGEDGLYTVWFIFNNGSILRDAEVWLDVNPCEKDACKMCEFDKFIDKIASCQKLIPQSNESSVTFHYGPENFESPFGYGSAAVYSCKEGYKVVGKEIRYCNEFNEWTGNEVSCEEIVQNTLTWRINIFILAGIVGCLILISLAILLFVFCRKYNKERKKRKDAQSQDRTFSGLTPMGMNSLLSDYLRLKGVRAESGM